SLEAGGALGGCRVVEIVGMKLPAEIAEALLELRGIEVQPARHAEKREVVAVAAEREDLRALRAEMRVDRGATAAVTTHLKRRGSRGSHREALTRRTSCRSRRWSSRSGC